MAFYLDPIHHVGPTFKTKEGFAFSTFSTAEGLNTRSYALRSQSAFERGALIRGLRMGGVSYISYPTAREFDRSVANLKALS